MYRTTYGQTNTTGSSFSYFSIKWTGFRLNMGDYYSWYQKDQLSDILVKASKYWRSPCDANEPQGLQDISQIVTQMESYIWVPMQMWHFLVHCCQTWQVFVTERAHPPKAKWILHRTCICCLNFQVRQYMLTRQTRVNLQNCTKNFTSVLTTVQMWEDRDKLIINA